jgi:LacI family transcriptional regulator
MTSKRLNLEDIAKKAGVSRSTVSRVINDDPNVNAKTRAHVWQVIQHERYQPNAIARMMVTRRSQVIGIIIPAEIHTVFIDPYYYPALLTGVMSLANERDYAILLWVRQSGEDEQRFYHRILGNGMMDGMIVCSASEEIPVHEQLHAAGVTFTMVERPKRFASELSYVTVDNISGTREAIRHLYEHGRRKIAILTGSLDNSDAQERLTGYHMTLDELGLPYDPSIVIEAHFDRHEAHQATKKLLEHKIDAIFSSNDLMAWGVYDALHELGLRIPEDIAVVGFDDLPTATELKPMLTTVRHPIVEKGRIAARLLIDLLEEKVNEHQHISLPATLVVRESSASPKKSSRSLRR